MQLWFHKLIAAFYKKYFRSSLPYPIFIYVKQGGQYPIHDAFNEAAKTAVIAFQLKNELDADNIYKVK